MSSGLAVLVGLSALASGGDSYADAYHQASKTGRPMVVLVSAEWCGACKTMEREVIPKMKQQGVFRQCSFARVDLDRERKLGRTLTRGGPIPQLLMYRRTRGGWLLSRLRGGQSARTVRAFIDRGLQRDAEAKKGEVRAEEGHNPSEKTPANKGAKQASDSQAGEPGGDAQKAPSA